MTTNSGFVAATTVGPATGSTGGPGSCADNSCSVGVTGTECACQGTCANGYTATSLCPNGKLGACTCTLIGANSTVSTTCMPNGGSVLPCDIVLGCCASFW
jgi:hypothetical protein